METHIQKWGNSLAIRIPRSCAVDSHLEENMTVEITQENDRLIITPVRLQRWSLNELLAGITPDNFHREADTGLAIGVEVMV
ncbi:MAG: AbrB/MazE/SpoVT family DNA-binding domain-containing protein [bacterium]